MLDCGLDMSPVLHFMPIPLVHSAKLSQLTRVTSKEKPALDGVSFLHLGDAVFTVHVFASLGDTRIADSRQVFHRRRAGIRPA